MRWRDSRGSQAQGQRLTYHDQNVAHVGTRLAISRGHVGRNGVDSVVVVAEDGGCKLRQGAVEERKSLGQVLRLRKMGANRGVAQRGWRGEREAQGRRAVRESEGGSS